MIGVFSNILMEDGNRDLTNSFNYYHAEIAREGFNPKNKGGWDEELYYKNIYDAIKDTTQKYIVKGKNKYSIYMYTMGDEYAAILLGKITVFNYGYKFDWEWEEQEDISQAMINYLRDEVQHENSRLNNKRKSIPEICPKCGSKIVLKLMGEPVWICSNDDCKEYFGVKPFKEESIINEDSYKYYNIHDIPTLNSYNLSGLAMDLILNELSSPDSDGTTTDGDENFDMPDDIGGDAEATPTNTGETDNNPSDNQNTDDTTGEDNAEEDENYDMEDNDTEGEDNNDDEGENTGEEEENFDLPEDGEEEGDGTGEEDMGGDTGDDSPSMDNGGLDQTKSKLQEIEDKIFDDLSDTDKQNRTAELKKLFLDLHANCSNIIEMVDDLPKSEDILKVIEFINKSLQDTKQFIFDYISNTFDSKSYMENMTEFQKYISVLYSIKGVLDELKNKNQ